MQHLSKNTKYPREWHIGEVLREINAMTKPKGLGTKPKKPYGERCRIKHLRKQGEQFRNELLFHFN